MPGSGTKEITKEKRRVKDKVKPPSRYRLILHDDDLHTYDYVIEMLMSIFRMSRQKAYLHALEVDSAKTTTIAFGPLQIMEEKHRQVQQFGADWRMSESTGPMRTTIETE